MSGTRQLAECVISPLMKRNYACQTKISTCLGIRQFDSFMAFLRGGFWEEIFSKIRYLNSSRRTKNTNQKTTRICTSSSITFRSYTAYGTIYPNTNTLQAKLMRLGVTKMPSFWYRCGRIYNLSPIGSTGNAFGLSQMPPRNSSRETRNPLSLLREPTRCSSNMWRRTRTIMVFMFASMKMYWGASFQNTPTSVSWMLGTWAKPRCAQMTPTRGDLLRTMSSCKCLLWRVSNALYEPLGALKTYQICNWTSRETCDFFRATLTKIHCIQGRRQGVCLGGGG